MNWFRRKNSENGENGKRVNAVETAPDGFTVAEEPIAPEVDQLRNGWTLEMAIPPRRLAALFMEHGWLLSIDDSGGLPTPAGMISFLTTQVEHIREQPDADYHQLGRLLFLQDDDFPDSVEIFLHVGAASAPVTNDIQEVTNDRL